MSKYLSICAVMLGIVAAQLTCSIPNTHRNASDHITLQDPFPFPLQILPNGSGTWTWTLPLSQRQRARKQPTSQGTSSSASDCSDVLSVPCRTALIQLTESRATTRSFDSSRSDRVCLELEHFHDDLPIEDCKDDLGLSWWPEAFSLICLWIQNKCDGVTGIDHGTTYERSRNNYSLTGKRTTLSLTLPAAAAGFECLDARHVITCDILLVWAVVRSAINGTRDPPSAPSDSSQRKPVHISLPQ
ncbi:hypothetical protein EK21DRAFT_95215 [Setomelanomma holmii]|uniref:Uncharacterized protein n=1 Tax=Setomelanomma holmii TaxID=210430 RepID=A0A9P4GW48_9PLEO|nr:hypothetical protein EK21DRAFT_95215 [Setomelanomma holmii]